MHHDKAAILAVPEVETVKVVENGYITNTIRRDNLMHAQTPQAFDTNLLVKCHQKAVTEQFKATDDAQLIEHYSDTPIKIVEGNYANIKITTMNDVSK
jgi:2-C-methyl-D-erythritol 4-phosphate cytidylyltransferase